MGKIPEVIDNILLLCIWSKNAVTLVEKDAIEGLLDDGSDSL